MTLEINLYYYYSRFSKQEGGENISTFVLKTGLKFKKSLFPCPKTKRKFLLEKNKF